MAEEIDRNLMNELNRSFLDALVDGGKYLNFKDAITLIREYLGADSAYFLLVEDGDILSVVFDVAPELERETILAISPPIRLPENLSAKVTLVTSPHKSIIGGLPFDSSLQIPVILEQRLVGLQEFGKKSGQLDRTRCEKVASVLHHFRHVTEYHYRQTIRLDQFRKTNLRLAHQEQMVNILLSQTHDMVISFTPQGQITSINEAGRGVIGLGPNEEPGTIALENPTVEFVVDFLERRASLTDFESVVNTKTGESKFCIASYAAEFDSSNHVSLIYGIFKDITDRVEAQRQLWEANIELNSTNQTLKDTQVQMVQQEKLASIGQLAAGVAHEINNPLGFIQSNHESLKGYVGKLLTYISLLENKVGNFEDMRKDAKVVKVLGDVGTLLDDSDEGFDRIAKIVRSLKDFSRMESRGELSLVDINKLINDTLVISRNSWKYAAEVVTDLKLDQTIEAYGDLLNQVFMNLVVNAAQAISGQKRANLGTIIIKTYFDCEHAIIQVSDDGPGIPQELRGRIFEPFFTTKPVGEGTGLGLSVSYDIIVKKHNGQLIIDNNPGGGACFTVKLPLMQDVDCSEVQLE